MKRITMKKWMGLLLLLAPFARADILADGSLTFGNDTKQVTVSTTTTSPTQIFSNDPYVTHSCIVNMSTYTLFISSASNSVSTSTNFMVPPSSSFVPDGPTVPYWGPMWAVLGVGPGQAGTAITGVVGIYRSK